MAQAVVVNWWSILVGILVLMAWGALWYSPLLFFRRWLARIGKGEAEATAGAGKAFGIAAVGSFLVSWIFATVLEFAETEGVVDGLLGGFFMGLFVAAAFAVNDFMERRPATLWLINSGYWMVAMLSLGAMMGAWR